jgi:5,5'-dehydrodivanillate O-demethylase
MIFPIFQRTDHHIGARIPVDDTHMVRYSVYADIKFDGQSNGSSKAHSSNGAIRYMPGHEKSKTPTDAIHPFATYRMDDVQPQDLMALETQGPIADRTTERLATSDRGIELYRQMLKREIERVQEGLEPMGIVHDPDHEPIDTYVREWIGMSLRYPTERRKG